MHERSVPPQNDGLRCIGNNKKDQDVFKKSRRFLEIVA